MDKETLFQAIGRREAVLWAGAGLSRYAGYPLGNGVVAQLYDALSDNQRQQLSQEVAPHSPPDLPLPRFAELLLMLQHGNRHLLSRVLRDIFTARPAATSVHEQLAALNCFQHIITTNYDELFERTFHPLTVVWAAQQLPLLDPHLPTLYPVHGRIGYPDSLIVADRDYRRFFEKADRLLWTQLEALLATQTVVFLGYAVEDPNVLDVFLRVRETLGVNMRPAYLVAPHLPPLRLAALQQQGIHHVAATAEEFVADLFAAEKKNNPPSRLLP